MNAVSNFSERRFGDIQEMKAVSLMTAAVAFGDVCRYRVRGLASLRAQLTPFKARKRLNREFVNLDEEIVGTLPRNERVMAKIQHATGRVQSRCRGDERAGSQVRKAFEQETGARVGTTYPVAAVLPLLPLLPK